MTAKLRNSTMKLILKRKQVFSYAKTFGSTIAFLPSLFVGGDTLNDIEPAGSVICTAMTCDKVKSGETGKIYDHNYLWTQMIQAGKVSSGGASPVDAFSIACKGQRVVATGEIDTSAGYFRTDDGSQDSFTNVKSAIQMEYNKGFKRPQGVGTYFYPNWLNQTILSEGQGTPTEHEWEVVGWDEAHPNCFQIDAHLGFYQYIPQDIFNEEMDKQYGTMALTLAETTQDKIDFLKATEISALQTCLDFCYNLYKLLKTQLYGKIFGLA